jgi:hypothetical protein
MDNSHLLNSWLYAIIRDNPEITKLEPKDVYAFLLKAYKSDVKKAMEQIAKEIEMM